MMNLDYLHEINEYGDNIVRLYDFDKSLAIKFREAIIETILNQGIALDLSTLAFIESRNCTLILAIADEDEGIVSENNKQFTCNLTTEGYENMIRLLEPFCNKESIGYQYLYDIDNPTDFLFSPGGTW